MSTPPGHGGQVSPPESYYFFLKHFEKKFSLKNMPKITYKIMRSEVTLVSHIKTGLGLRNFHFGKHFKNGHQDYSKYDQQALLSTHWGYSRSLNSLY